MSVGYVPRSLEYEERDKHCQDLERRFEEAGTALKRALRLRL